VYLFVTDRVCYVPFLIINEQWMERSRNDFFNPSQPNLRALRGDADSLLKLILSLC
jgi:hypothetical protein